MIYKKVIREAKTREKIDILEAGYKKSREANNKQILKPIKLK